MKIKFPVIDNKKLMYPSKPLCPICKEKKVWEPHSMAIISGGALEKLGKDHFVTSDGDKIAGFLSLVWHGAHDEGEGDFREKGHTIDIVDQASDGQFMLAFCSTACLRTFLNQAVEELERQISND
jgi:hypothetical protein